MTRSNSTRAVAFVVASLVVPTTAATRAFVHGAPAAHTGGFGEPTCHACHFDRAINDPSGQLALEGLPGAIVPGASYPITVRLSRPGMARAGVQLTARVADGDERGQRAGVLTPTDERIAVAHDPATALDYATHTPIGSVVSGPSASWSVVWQAPAHATAVVFHVSANAGNDDESPLGDFVYTAERRIEVSRPSR